MEHSILNIENYYDETYFEWQKKSGTLGASLNSQIFSPFISSSDALLDFGCGGGFLLSILKASVKLGVEINESARSHADGLGIQVVRTLSEVPNGAFDVVISNHALEHTEQPLAVIKELRRKLKPGGACIVVVPSERYDTPYRPGNIDQHLYTWSPINLGNIFRRAGFEVEEVKRYAHLWPPKIDLIDKLFGRKICNLACRSYAYLRPKLTQIRIIAKNPD